MDLERLSKHQIVLLTMLVSFVSSITTGIVTVSLLGQAPPGVTKTINQIVERTIEKVVPSSPTQAAAVVTQKTVVVKDDDLAAQSIAVVQKSVVRIVGRGSDELIARGIIVDAKGTAITDSDALENSGYSNFEAIMPNGERVKVTLPKTQGTSTPLVAVSLAVGTSTGFGPAAIADQSKIRLGQSVIRIGGTNSDIVGSGLIAAMPARGSIELQASVSSSVPGSFIMTLFGEVVGISTAQSLEEGATYYTLATIPTAPAESTAATNTVSNS